MAGSLFGVGFLGVSHAHTNGRLACLARARHVENLGFYEPDATIARQFQERHGLRRFDSPEELLTEPGLRLAIVEAFEQDGPDLAILAADHQIPFLLEKPGAPASGRLREVIEAAERNGVLGHVGYMLRYSPALAEARAILASGVLGPVTLARFHAATPAGLAGEIWQSRPENPGGLLYTIGCHMVDLICQLLGKPERVQAVSAKLIDGPEVTIHGFKENVLSGAGETRRKRMGDQRYEDIFAALLQYDDLLATFDLTGWEAHRWIESWTLDFYGVEGTLHISILPPKVRIFTRESGWRDAAMPELALGDAIAQVFAAELEDLIDRVTRGERTATASLDQALVVVEVMEELYAAAGQTSSRVR